MAKLTAKTASRKNIHEIATLYAEKPAEYSYRYFCEEYGISKGTFYTILDKAVIENIVDSATVKKMAKKAANNSEAKAGKGAEGRSRRHYYHLIQKRAIYELPKKEAIDVAIKYAKRTILRKEFLEQNFITSKLLDRTLLKAIENNWIDDDTVDRIKKKALLERGKSSETIVFWDKLESVRNENKKSQG